ncbi:MAG: hypothetical protein ACFFDC_16660 [Promethearchaeota archaeon]
MWRKSFTLVIIIFCCPSIISCIGQDNHTGPTSLEWHENIKIDTILGWRITELISLDTNPVKIGEIQIDSFDIVQIGFVRNPPVKAREFFGFEYLVYHYKPPIWMNLFVKSFRVDLKLAQFDLDISKTTDFVYLQLFSLPIEYLFEDGSSSSLDYFLDIFGTVIFDFQNYTVTQINGSFLVEWYTGIDTNKTSYSYTISQTTGVTTRFLWNTSKFRMVWDYFNEAATLNLNGDQKILEDPYSVQLVYPKTTSWEFIGLFFLILIPLGLLLLKITLNKLGKSFLSEDFKDSEERGSIHYSMKWQKSLYHRELHKSDKKE